MATKQRVDIDVVVKNTQRIDRLEKALGKTSVGASSLGRAAKFAAGAIAAIGVGAAIRSLVRVGSQVENLGLRFKFLFGSAEEGAKAFEVLTQFASKVPFSLEQISAASGNLAVVAKDANELNDILEITGNVAAVSGLDFQTAGEQIQRALSGGIAAADIFRERGVRSLLGFKEGATVTAEETRAAFFRVFGKGGQFGQATDEFANTLDGTISMLQDKLFKFQDVASREFFDELKGQLGDLNQFFEENQETIDNFAKDVGAGLSKAVVGTGKAVIFLKDNLTGVKVVLVGILALKTVFAFRSIATAVGLTTVAFKKLAPALVLTAKLSRKHPLILLGTIGAIAGLALFGDEIDKLTEKLFGNADALDISAENLNDFNTEIDESTRLQNLQNHLLSGTVAVYDEYHTAQDIAINKQKLQNQEMEASIPLYEKMKGSQKSFIKGILTRGESELERINRQEREDLKQLEEAYQKDQRETKEYQNLKTKITEDAIKQRAKLEDDAEKARQDRFTNAIEAIKQGKIAELDFDKLNTKQKVEVAAAGLTDMLSNAATFNKKAFELNKKAQIAVAIVNTAAGVTQALKAYPPPFSFIMAAAQLAAGIAQVNAIKSTQFQGREKGGRVSRGQTYVVGEAGMELFTPDQSGTIIPNNQLGSNEVTINFNITATDASSFDDLLVERRDTIVGVINEALNENGKRSLIQ